MIDKKNVLKRIKYSKHYAIAKSFIKDETNMVLFEEMYEKGYDLICLTFVDAIFKKRSKK